MATMSTSTQFMNPKLDLSLVEIVQESDGWISNINEATTVVTLHKETMNRVPARARSLPRVARKISVAGAVLASCATATVTAPHVTGVPVDQHLRAALLRGVHDQRFVRRTGDVKSRTSTPTSFGEYRVPSGRWARLSVPTADSSTYIAASSCWMDGCLFVGSQSSGDLLWRYDESTRAVTDVTAPSVRVGHPSGQLLLLDDVRDHRRHPERVRGSSRPMTAAPRGPPPSRSASRRAIP